MQNVNSFFVYHLYLEIKMSIVDSPSTIIQFINYYY